MRPCRFPQFVCIWRDKRIRDPYGRFAQVGHPAIHYLHRSVPIDELVALYLAADMMLVTPLRDGMNLVAKEYLASQDPGDPGVLVLSRFAGAARECEAALLVNPYDSESMANAIAHALSMPLDERRYRSYTRIYNEDER